MTDKILRLLGLCVKSGGLAPGDSAVKDAILRGRAHFVIIAEDCGENTRKKFERLCSEKNVECAVFCKKSVIGRAVGKDEKAVVAVTDKNFADAVGKLINRL
ncbi:MAG: ribosomal L7Ae/L30e/S12e/Gadd45 family protein [Bacillota bacterium]|nr:ribosomal L7Ae/L30e/S12e/Gadd45 family protein [Bacillota bacterium]